MGSAKDSFRTAYARTESVALARTELAEQIEDGDFDGRYFRVVDDVRQLPDGRFRLKVVAQHGKHEVGRYTFDLEHGAGTFEWHDKDPD